MDPIMFHDFGSGRDRDAVQVARSGCYSAPVVQGAAQALADEVERLRAKLAEHEQRPDPVEIADRLAGSPAAYTLSRYVNRDGVVLSCTAENWDALQVAGLVSTSPTGHEVRRVTELGEQVRLVLLERRHG